MDDQRAGGGLPPVEVRDLSLAAPKMNADPLPEYAEARLDYGMTIGLERTPGGRLWTCRVAGGDDENGFFVLNWSDDDGASWTDTKVVIDPHGQDVPFARRALVGNLWTDPRGRLWLFFDQSLTYFDGRAGDWCSVCDDPDAQAPCWSAPRRLWHGATLNKPIVLESGEWLLPVSLWTRRCIHTAFAEAFHELDQFRMAHVFVSRDEGCTWDRRGGVLFPESEFDEHMIVQRRDGSLRMLARTRHDIWESFSTDDGASWSGPRPSGIKNVSARFFFRRLRSGRILLVKHGLAVDERTEGRSHLTAFLSEDDGVNWEGGLLLDEREGVSYPDGVQAPDGTIYISYDRNRSTDGQILLARFTEEDVLAGSCVSPRSRLRTVVSSACGRHRSASG